MLRNNVLGEPPPKEEPDGPRPKKYGHPGSLGWGGAAARSFTDRLGRALPLLPICLKSKCLCRPEKSFSIGLKDICMFIMFNSNYPKNPGAQD